MLAAHKVAGEIGVGDRVELFKQFRLHYNEANAELPYHSDILITISLIWRGWPIVQMQNTWSFRIVLRSLVQGATT